MTTLLLIRHGQASFGAANYDRLSAMGVRQAALLGSHLVGEGRMPQVAYSGALERQIDTARHARSAAGLPSPAMVRADFDEYNSAALFQELLPKVAERDPALSAGAELRTNRRLFQKALAGVLESWIDQSADFSGETFLAFQARVHHGLEAALAGRGNDETIAIFTSGGVIGLAVGDALGLGPHQSLALSWRIHNASISELSFGRNGFALTAFNTIAHLRLTREPALITYR